jgi:phosphatidylglycerophosphate synthase
MEQLNMSLQEEAREKTKTETWLTYANMFTFARFVLVTAGFILLLLGFKWLGFAIYVTAGITDKLDGWAAKYLDHKSTHRGEMLDRMADKYLMISAMSYLILQKQIIWFLALLIIIGEIILAIQAILSFLRNTKTDSLKAGWSGKLKMWLECLAALFCFINLKVIGTVVIVGAIIMMVASIHDHFSRSFVSDNKDA